MLDQFRSTFTSVDRLRNLILLAYHCINNPYFPSYNSILIMMSSAAYLVGAQVLLAEGIVAVWNRGSV